MGHSLPFAPRLSTLPDPSPRSPPLNGGPPFPFSCPLLDRIKFSSLPQHLHSTLNQGSAEELFAYHLYPGPSPLSESPLDLRRKVVVTVPLLRPTRQTPARHKPSSANLLPISWITNAGSSRPATGSVLCIPTAGTGRHISTGGPKAQHTEKGPLFPHNQSQSM